MNNAATNFSVESNLLTIKSDFLTELMSDPDTDTAHRDTLVSDEKRQEMEILTTGESAVTRSQDAKVEARLPIVYNEATGQVVSGFQ